MASLNQAGKRYDRIFLSFVLSLIFQLLSVGMIALLARSVIPSISFSDWCWIGGMVTFIMMFPFSVGGLGLREGGFIALLSLLGTSREHALTLSLTLYTIQLIGAFSGALVFLSTIIRRDKHPFLQE